MNIKFICESCLNQFDIQQINFMINAKNNSKSILCKSRSCCFLYQIYIKKTISIDQFDKQILKSLNIEWGDEYQSKIKFHSLKYRIIKVSNNYFVSDHEYQEYLQLSQYFFCNWKPIVNCFKIQNSFNINNLQNLIPSNNQIENNKSSVSVFKSFDTNDSNINTTTTINNNLCFSIDQLKYNNIFFKIHHKNSNLIQNV